MVAWRANGRSIWGLEAAMLSAGSCVEWIVNLGLVSTPEVIRNARRFGPRRRRRGLRACIERHGRSVVGLGARGAFVGLSASTSRAEVVRAVLEGIAHAGADLLEAIEADANLHVDTLHVDGGMTANRTFVELVASANQRVVVPSAVREATMLGAAFVAGAASGVWPSLDSTPKLIRPEEAVEPRYRLDRQRWFDARGRAFLKIVPALSAISF